MIILLLIICLTSLLLCVNNRLEVKGLNEELAIAFRCIDKNRNRIADLERYNEYLGNPNRLAYWADVLEGKQLMSDKTEDSSNKIS